MTPNKILNRGRCPRCSEKNKGIAQRKKHSDFVSEVKELVGDEYSVISEYKTAKTKIEIKHNECGKKFEMTPDNFRRGNRCPYCAVDITAMKKRKNTEEFIEENPKLKNGEFILLEDYIKGKLKIKFKHMTCGNIFELRPDNFSQRQSCPICSNKRGHRKESGTLEDFKLKVKKLVGDEYRVADNAEYLNMKTRVLMEHVMEDEIHRFSVRPDNFIHGGRRCPKCNISGPELRIKEYLMDNNIKFEREYSDPRCKDKGELRFDFKIYNPNKKDEFFLLEYDGEYHFNPIKGEKRLKSIQRRDKIKDEFCKTHDIDLYRIHYENEDNIEEILFDLIKVMFKIDTV
jgi:DNA-directed RNA polymerase subunit RPC12/RpoP